MNCPNIEFLPVPPAGRTGWPWIAGAVSDISRLPPRPSLTPWPRITIVMPCLNAERFIEEALRSVLLQGYPDLELMVFDGGSTDGTVGIVKRYAPWLVYWESENDRGQSHAINKGLERATGKLFNWFNADDVMCTGALFVLAAMSESAPNAIGFFGSMLSFDEQGGQTVWKAVPGNKEEIGNWATSCFLPQPSALFDCRLCKQIGGVNEKLHYVMDIELMMRLADFGQFVATPEITAHFRAHAGSKTVQGDIPGLVELVAADFNLGLTYVARQMLQRRMDGYAGLAIDRLSDEKLAKVVDRWSYASLVRYIFRRIKKNLKLRMGLPH